MKIKPSEKKFLIKLCDLGYQVILLPNDRFIGIGDGSQDDSVVDGSISCTLERAVEMDSDGQVYEFDFDSSVIDFITETKKSRAIAIFSLTASEIMEMKEAIWSLEATHIRFHQRAGSVWVSIFDYRSFLYDHRIRKDHPFTVGLECLYKKCKTDFSFTINSPFFKKLLDQDYSVRIGENGYAEFSSAEYKKNDFSYLVKGQDVIEPVVTFFNAPHVLDISFVPVANLIPVDPHTTPRTDQ